MKRQKNPAIDKTIYGVLAGLLLPMLVFVVIYLVGKENMPFLSYLKGLWKMESLVPVMSLCVFANLALFMLFIRLKYDRAARGVLASTIFYALAVLISKAV